MAKLISVIIICFISTITTAPIGKHSCLDQDIQSLKLEDTKFIAPVLVDGQKELLFFPNKDNVGYVDATNLQARFMDLDTFKKNYKLPENVQLAYVEGLQPSFRMA